MATFELKMTRTHATQTKTESFRDGALQFEVPLRETVIATLNSDQDLFALDTSELVALASAQLPPRTDAPQEGWLPWKACMLREDYPEVPPAPLLNEAYSKMVLGTWGRRLKTLGFEDKGFHPLDYRLPPRAKSFDKAR